MSTFPRIKWTFFWFTMERLVFEIGDLIVYKSSIQNYFMVPEDDHKIGVAVDIVNEDNYGGKTQSEPGFITVVHVLWSDGTVTRDPIILLEKYEDVQPSRCFKK